MAGRGALHEERVGELGEEAIVELAHLGVRGKEAEGATAGDLEDAADFLRSLGEEVRVARRRHTGRKVEEGLLGVVEVAGDDELFGKGDAEAALEVVEAGSAVLRGDGKGGGGEDDAGVVGEERVGEERGDVDGRGEEVGAEGEWGGRNIPGPRIRTWGTRIRGMDTGVAGGIAEAGGGAAFDPEDGVGIGGFEEEF